MLHKIVFDKSDSLFTFANQLIIEKYEEKLFMQVVCHCFFGVWQHVPDKEKRIKQLLLRIV